MEKNDDNQSLKEPPAGGVTPTIVTSPAPDYEDVNSTCNANSGEQSVDTASSGCGGSRRGSVSTVNVMLARIVG